MIELVRDCFHSILINSKPFLLGGLHIFVHHWGFNNLIIIIMILYRYIIETNMGRVCVFVEVNCYETNRSDCNKII